MTLMYINFRRIKSHIDIIESLKIISTEIIQHINRELVNSDLNDT